MKKILALAVLTLGLSAFAEQKQEQQNPEQNQCVEKQVVIALHAHDTGRYHEEMEQSRVVTVLDCGDTEPVSEEVKAKAKQFKAKIPSNIQDTEKP
jgi:hypothetical protein